MLTNHHCLHLWWGTSLDFQIKNYDQASLSWSAGVKKAIIAVAHRLLTAVYYMLLNHEPYRAPGGAPV